ncbi:MAG: lipoyl(octanoyl) transferase LipB [Actinomycetes bacterium]
MTEYGTAADAPPRLAILRVGLGSVLVPYQQAWELQREIHSEVVAGQRRPTALLLEHEPVFTAGRRTPPTDLPTDGSPVIDVDRGGRITWHGPGQLVCYPIVALGQPFDVVAHVRRLEETVIRTCADFGTATARVPGRSGVWCESSTGADRKIAAVGVRVARGVTMHGIALNVSCDLGWTRQIVPCGIDDAQVTSMTAEIGEPVDLLAVADVFERHLRAVLEPTLGADDTRNLP